MIKTLNWNGKAEIAKGMTENELLYAVSDCVKCVRLGIDSGYYSDEASVYRAELTKRGYDIKNQNTVIQSYLTTSN
jgi:hypothetical protein